MRVSQQFFSPRGVFSKNVLTPPILIPSYWHDMENLYFEQTFQVICGSHPLRHTSEAFTAPLRKEGNLGRSPDHHSSS